MKPLELYILQEKGKNSHFSRTSRNGAFLRPCLFLCSFPCALTIFVLGEYGFRPLRLYGFRRDEKRPDTHVYTDFLLDFI